MAEEIKINATLVFEITSKRHWINAFPGAIPELPKTEKYIWIDSKGNTANCGEDFMKADSAGTYPVKVYLLQRICHTEKNEYTEGLLKYLGL
ncbi:hypothetical protein [Flavobacterium granuli]|uniref:Uncharacterized protein n=1 Tax=Flavobacterium granuli TaxID=280093 RepID=A0ABU1S0C8_9FLAO|nr:hypothetical protein [Flavobacterium granuli]MDR6844486.1 hypothetical protein [Flavobacterium granuli]